jgi:hypothetical protein
MQSGAPSLTNDMLRRLGSFRGTETGFMSSLFPTNGFGWYAVASSADGAKLVAMMVDELTPAGPMGPIYTSSAQAQSRRFWRRTDSLLDRSVDTFRVGTDLRPVHGHMGPPERELCLKLHNSEVGVDASETAGDDLLPIGVALSTLW